MYKFRLFLPALTLVRIALVGLAMFLVACQSLEGTADNQPARPLVKYSYTGPNFTVFTGALPAWNSESRLTGYFIVEELPPRTTINFLDPGIHFTFPNVPKKFVFSDGARTIVETDIVNVVNDTGGRIDLSKHEIRAFSVTTDSAGGITAWDVLFVHEDRRNAYLTSHNSGVYGQDLSELGATQFGCVATEKCTANANYTRSGAVPELADTQAPGSWTKEIVESY
ncbi:MAG: hypothetical protein ACR2P6_02155 [Gammaproteobacteria bacterium]